MDKELRAGIVCCSLTFFLIILTVIISYGSNEKPKNNLGKTTRFKKITEKFQIDELTTVQTSNTAQFSTTITTKKRTSFDNLISTTPKPPNKQVTTECNCKENEDCIDGKCICERSSFKEDSTWFYIKSVDKCVKCPYNYSLYHNEFCYHLSNDYRNFYDAAEKCKDDGAQLLSLRGTYLRNWERSLLFELDRVNSKQIWVGLESKHGVKFKRISDGYSSLPEGKGFFFANHKLTGYPEKPCLATGTGQNKGFLIDTDCYDEYLYICIKDIRMGNETHFYATQLNDFHMKLNYTDYCENDEYCKTSRGLVCGDNCICKRDHHYEDDMCRPSASIYDQYVYFNTKKMDVENAAHRCHLKSYTLVMIKSIQDIEMIITALSSQIDGQEFWVIYAESLNTRYTSDHLLRIIGSTYGYNNGDPIVQYRTNEGIFDLKGKDIDKNLWKSILKHKSMGCVSVKSGIRADQIAENYDDLFNFYEYKYCQTKQLPSVCGSKTFF